MPKQTVLKAYTITCCNLAFLLPSVKHGGSISSSRSIFWNSSIVSWLDGVASNSANLKIILFTVTSRKTAANTDRQIESKNRHVYQKPYSINHIMMTAVKDKILPFSDCTFTDLDNPHNIFYFSVKVMNSACNQQS